MQTRLFRPRLLVRAESACELHHHLHATQTAARGV